MHAPALARGHSTTRNAFDFQDRRFILDALPHLKTDLNGMETATALALARPRHTTAAYQTFIRDNRDKGLEILRRIHQRADDDIVRPMPPELDRLRNEKPWLKAFHGALDPVDLDTTQTEGQDSTHPPQAPDPRPQQTPAPAVSLDAITPAPDSDSNDQGLAHPNPPPLPEAENKDALPHALHDDSLDAGRALSDAEQNHLAMMLSRLIPDEVLERYDPHHLSLSTISDLSIAPLAPPDAFFAELASLLPAGPSAARWKMHYEHAAAAYTVFALQLLAGEAASQSEDELLGNADTEEEVDELEESGAASNQGLPVSGITAPQEPTQLPASSGSAHHTITPVMRAHMVATQAPMVSPATQPQILEGSQQNVPTPAARAQAPAAPQTVTTEAPLSQPIFQPTLPGRTQDVATPVPTTPAATTTQLIMTPSGFIQNSSTLPQGTLAGQDGFQARAPITGEIKTSPQVADRPEDLTGRPQWSTRRVRRRTESITEASFSVTSQRRVEPPRRLRLATPLARDAIVLETQDSEFVAQQAEPSTHQPIDLADSSSSLSEPPETQPPLTWLPGGITLKQYRQRQTISVAGPSAGAQEPDGQPAVALNQLLAEAADVDTQSQMPVPPGRRPKPRKSRPPGGKAIRPSPPLVFEEAPDGRELSRIDTSDSKARSSSDSNHSSGVQAHSRSHESFRRSPSLHATPGPGDSDTSGLEDDWDQPTGGQESCGRRSSPRFALRFEGSPLGSAPGSVPSSTTTSSSAQVGHSGQRVSDTQSNAHLPGPALLGAPTQALSLTPSHHIGLSTQDLPSQWSESYESHLQSQLPSQSPSHPSSKHHPNFESQLHPQSKHNPKILGGEGPPERPEQAQMLSNERDFFTPASSSPSVSNASHLSGLSLGPTGALSERPAHRAPVLKSELYTRTQQSGSQAEGETPWTQPAVPPLVDTLQQVDSLPYRSLIQEPPLPNSFTQLQTVEEAITPASARTGGMPPATPSLHAVGKERESPAPAAPQSNASRSTRGTKRTVSLSMVAQSRGHDDVLHGRPPKRMRARGFSAASGRNERSRSAATTTSASTSASIPVSISNMTQAEAYRRQLRALRHDYGLMRHHAEYWLGPQMSITHARRQIEARFNEVLAANPLLRREKVERLFAVVEGDPTLFARSLRQFGWE